MAPPKILVVDDQPINVQLLKRKLEKESMVILTAYNGSDALEIVSKEHPDLILLDVMMPDMDGIEVCQRIQANEETRPIPIIFITARTSKEGKLEGLGAGAVDYITKPIDLDETLARVQTQLRVVMINREMQELQSRLAEARRVAVLGAVTQGIAHNLNNLLGIVIGYLDLIRAFSDKPELVRKNVQHVDDAVQRIVTIIKQLSTLLVRARPPVIPTSLQRVINCGISRYHADYSLNQPVVVNNPLGEARIETNIEIFEDVLAKVLINAWESYGDKPEHERPISITARQFERPGEGNYVELRIEDRGHGIDPEVKDHMFEPFISSKHTVGVGMGLTVARHAMRNLGGEVTLEPRAGGGAIAVITHPVEKRQIPKEREDGNAD
jgi:CheY-like chemotaxis protein